VACVHLDLFINILALSGSTHLLTKSLNLVTSVFTAGCCTTSGLGANFLFCSSAYHFLNCAVCTVGVNVETIFQLEIPLTPKVFEAHGIGDHILLNSCLSIFYWFKYFKISSSELFAHIPGHQTLLDTHHNLDFIFFNSCLNHSGVIFIFNLLTADWMNCISLSDMVHLSNLRLGNTCWFTNVSTLALKSASFP